MCLLRYWRYLRNQWFLRVSSCLKQTEDTLLCCLIKRQLTYPNWTWAWNKFSLSLSPFQCIIDFFSETKSADTDSHLPALCIRPSCGTLHPSQPAPGQGWIRRKECGDRELWVQGETRDKNLCWIY